MELIVWNFKLVKSRRKSNANSVRRYYSFKISQYFKDQLIEFWVINWENSSRQLIAMKIILFDPAKVFFIEEFCEKNATNTISVVDFSSLLPYPQWLPVEDGEYNCIRMLVLCALRKRLNYIVHLKTVNG